MSTVTLQGDRVVAHFDSFGIADYDLFLQAKALPEYEVEFDELTEHYRITAPARFASFFFDDSPSGQLSPSCLIGGDGDSQRKQQSGTYIYALIDPFTNDIRYIGKSVRPRERLSNHCNERSKCHRTNWIQSVIASGSRPIMLLLERLDSKADWQPVERDWIAYGRERGWPLTNGTDGGDGVSGLTAEARERIRTAWIGRKHTPEAIRQIGRASKGRRHTEEHKRRMSELMKQRVFTPQHRSRLSNAGRKLSDAQAIEMRKRFAAGELMKDLAVAFGVERTTARFAIRGLGVYASIGDTQP